MDGVTSVHLVYSLRDSGPHTFNTIAYPCLYIQSLLFSSSNLLKSRKQPQDTIYWQLKNDMLGEILRSIQDISSSIRILWPEEMG